MNLSHAESVDEILNVSVKFNEQAKNLPLRVAGAEPIFIKVEQNEANAFVEMSVYLATDINKKFTISSDLKDFFATVDGAKTLTDGKDKVTFVAQDSRIQIFAYGEVPKKNLFTVMRVVGDSDLLNVLARGSTEAESSSQNPKQQQPKKDQEGMNPLENPVLKKLTEVIDNSALPNKDHYLLALQNIERTYQDGGDEEAVTLALETIDKIEEQSRFLQQNQRSCEKSKLKILETQDFLSQANIPQQALKEAQQHLEYAKGYQESFLCDESYISAEKAIASTQLNPLESVSMSYPWLLPGGIIVGIAVAALAVVQRLRSENMGAGLR